MKPYVRLLVLLFIFFFTVVFAPVIFADAKTDYDYQYGQYRTSYAEFVILKQDYLNTPSLDNQQKAMLSAKQTILARDLAKASLDWYLLDQIGGYKTAYEPINQVIGVLASARQYFLANAQKSQSIVTQDDLKKFTSDYMEVVAEKDSYTKYGIVAAKIAALVRIQLDSKTALEIMIPKLPTPYPAGLSARIQELKSSAKAIDLKIDEMAANLNLAEAVGQTQSEIFFTERMEKLIEIRAMQLDWINRLIDIDINYVQPQI